MKERIEALEAHVKCLYYITICFVLLTLFNFGVTIWYFQQKSDPDWNFISVTLTIFELLIVVALVGGFWMLRGAAESAASREAKIVAKKIAAKVARKEAIGWAEILRSAQNTDTDNQDLEAMINSLGDAKDEGGGK